MRKYSKLSKIMAEAIINKDEVCIRRLIIDACKLRLNNELDDADLSALASQYVVPFAKLRYQMQDTLLANCMSALAMLYINFEPAKKLNIIKNSIEILDIQENET